MAHRLQRCSRAQIRYVIRCPFEFHRCNASGPELNISVRSPVDADVLEGDEVVVGEPFSPAFTYPIFGEQEKIFGYKGLTIQVSPQDMTDGQPTEERAADKQYSSTMLLVVCDNTSESTTTRSSSRKPRQLRISKTRCTSSSPPTIPNRPPRSKRQ